MALYKIWASRVNNAEAAEFEGDLGQIWYDETTGNLRLYTGVPGGEIINNSGGGSASQLINGNSNVVVYPNADISISVNGISNVVVFGADSSFIGNIVTTGNITASFFVGDIDGGSA